MFTIKATIHESESKNPTFSLPVDITGTVEGRKVTLRSYKPVAFGSASKANKGILTSNDFGKDFIFVSATAVLSDTSIAEQKAIEQAEELTSMKAELAELKALLAKK